MQDQNRQGPKEQGFEEMLRGSLGRVSAPGELWFRVQSGRQAPQQTSGSGWQGVYRWAAVAAVVAAGVVAWQWNQPPMTVEAMAVASLKESPERLMLHSNKPVEIRAWLRQNAGLDVPLPPIHSAMIEIEGASVVQRGEERLAEVAYRVGDHKASLLVARDPSGARTYPNHEARASDPYESARVTSWAMKGQAYTLAFAAEGVSRDSRVACLLCHGAEPDLTRPRL